MSFSLLNNPKLQAIPTLVKGRILLVDDDPQDLGFYAMVLYKQGYKVVPCDSFQEAMKCLETESLDFVVLSQGGPAFEGRSVLERAVRPDLRIPALILASWVEMSLYTEAMSLGAVDYFQKTADPSEFLRALKIYLRHGGQPWLAHMEAGQAAEVSQADDLGIFPSHYFGGRGES